MTQRRRYDDKFRASAVVMLRAAGYPDKVGALTEIANHLGVPYPTLSRWYNEVRNPPPNELVQEKTLELRDLLKREIQAIFEEMPNARSEASYKDLGTVAGILIDKSQLLEGKPTDRVAVQDELSDADRAARITAILDAARARRTGQADRDGETDDAGGG